MITLDILEQRLLQFPYFDACLVSLMFIVDYHQPDIYIAYQNTTNKYNNNKSIW